jgi:hypothetical protein
LQESLRSNEIPSCAIAMPRAAASRPEIGDGMVYRACAMVQRSLFHPPPDDLEHHELRPLKRFR